MLNNQSEPISAFAVYSKNKKPDTARNKRKQSSRKPAAPHVPAKKAKKQFQNKEAAPKKPLPVPESTAALRKSQKNKKSNKDEKAKSLKKDEAPELVQPALRAPPSPKKLASPPTTDNNPTMEAEQLFKWMIAPVDLGAFFAKHWEQQPIHIKRNKPKYYAHILDSARVDSIFRENLLYYTRNVDVVSYENGVKEVFNQEGRAVPAALWDYYSNGCSIRLLNPHTYNRKVHLLIATLQEYFGSMVGTNVYLTPPGSQGFAPHFDDIEAFVVQLEGRKHWKLYRPKEKDALARESSPNFKPEEIGDPFMELTLEAGDILYFPRGTIHEGRTDDEAHSLHVTVSVYQHTAYADLLEHVLPAALKTAVENNVELRKGLPLNYLKKLGRVNAHKKSKERDLIAKNVKKMLHTLIEHIDIDGAVDHLGRKFLYDSMPPVPSKIEAQRMSLADGDYLVNGKVKNRVEIGLDTKVRLLRYHCVRLVVVEDATPKLYYNTENARVYHDEEEQWLELDYSMVELVCALQNSYPRYVEVERLPMKDLPVKLQLISDLWERGILVTEEPLPTCDDDDDDDEDEDDEAQMDAEESN